MSGKERTFFVVKKLLAIVAIFLALVLFYFAVNRSISQDLVDYISPVGIVSEDNSSNLIKYSISNLRRRKFAPSEIEIGSQLKQTDSFSSHMFYFDSDGKKVSGLVNIPDKSGKLPIIVMLRGFIERDLYTPGEGSRNTAEAFASAGYITFAPDFLGYGESDMPSVDALEERFQTYTVAVNLINSLKKSSNITYEKNGEILIDNNNIGLWGHSNGGHIALAVLEITTEPIPTVLWAPVSKPFPYSILYFTDEFEDEGKFLREIVADFEEHLDVKNYSVTTYFDFINAPLQIHQGALDEAVPKEWSDEFVEKLNNLERKVTYYVYSQENHNFTNGSWNTLVSRSLSFYSDFLNDL